jgi:integrase
VPRRRFQQGCLKIVGGQWVLYYWQDEIRDGERVRVKVSKRLGSIELSKRSARKLAQPILDAANHQTDIPIRDSNAGVSLGEFIPDWRKHVANSLKPSTLRSMESSIRAHLIPLLGDTPLTEIGTKRIQELITSMEGRARGTVENVVMDLQQILTAARKWHNGIPAVKKSDLYFGKLKAGEGKPFFFTVNQVRAILKAFAGRKPWDLFFTLLALSGLRASEILGLRVEDMDFDNNQIHVRQGVWHGKVQTVKTRESENTVPMTPLVREKLQAHLVNHAHELLFVNGRGRPYSRNKVVQTVLHPVVDRLGISRKGRRVGLHAFRHALASMLLQTTGAAVTQRQLRHADASTTLGIYGHVLGDDQREAMGQIESVLSQP